MMRSRAIRSGFFCPCCGSTDIAPYKDRVYNTICTRCGTKFRIADGISPADYADDVTNGPYELVDYSGMPVENIGVMARFLYPELRWTAGDPELCGWLDDYMRYMKWLNRGNGPFSSELVEFYGDLVSDITSFGGSQELKALADASDPRADELASRLEAICSRYW